MAGLGDMAYLGACALFLGASKSDVALLVTIPVFLGACAQLVTPILMDRFGRRKRLFVAGSLVQALAWIPMIVALFVPRPLGYWFLLGGVVLSFASIHLGVPAWTSVMGDLVPSSARGRFFGRRSALALFLQLLAMLLAGTGLAVYKEAGHEALGFAVVFGGALLARLISVVYLARMAEPPYTPREEDRFTLVQFLRRLPESNFAKFVLFVAFMNATAHFAGCLFIPYWRDTLGYSYWEYMAVVSALIFVQVGALPLWGRAADRYGNRRVLVATSVGIVVLPALWLLSTHVAWAVFLQMWSGFVWSGFNQSVANFLLDAVTPGKRARCTAYLNLLLNTGLLVGGIAGSWAIRHVPADLGFIRLPHPFWTLLLLSTGLRLLTVLLLLPRFKEVRPVPEVGMVDMLFHASRETAESAINLVTGLVSRDGEEEKEPSGTAGGS
jgi:MFS family permease